MRIFYLFIALFFGRSIPSFADSLDIKIGQMLMVGMSGNTVHSESPILQDIKKGIVGGIVLFELNLNPSNTKKNLKQLTQDLQNAAAIPLLITIDQEGGQVNRLKTKYGYPAMPSAKSIGNKNNDAMTHAWSATIANALMESGITVNYAPVLDMHNPKCPVLGKRERCFSANPNDITKHASILIEEHHNLGIKTALKHFPGHGSSLSDTHLGIADVTKNWSQKELEPYRNLINEGIVDIIMTAHIINKKLDPSGLPATLSSKIVTGLLRNELGYRGVIISDDMQMHAITKYYGVEESILKCINAGVDILLFSNNIKGSTIYNVENIHAIIKKLVLSNKISFARIQESYDRIMALKRAR